MPLFAAAGYLDQLMSGSIVPSSEPDGLAGLKVLVVEDEPAISMLLEDMLDDLGCRVVGPAANIAEALTLAADEEIDLAVLDVNVGGKPIYPVVETLVARNIGLVFSTGYGSGGIDERFRDRPVLPKPFGQVDLERRLREALANP